MPRVVSSVATPDSVPQIDGRVWVTETHSLDDGTTRIGFYLAAQDADLQAIAREHGAAIDAELNPERADGA